jgi:hypothetical protein
MARDLSSDLSVVARRAKSEALAKGECRRFGSSLAYRKTLLAQVLYMNEKTHLIVN